MASFQTTNQSVQHFPNRTGSNDYTFFRPIHSLYLTTTGAVSISFDNGQNFMALTAGTYSWYHLHLNKIFFTGAGTYEGCGMAI